MTDNRKAQTHRGPTPGPKRILIATPDIPGPVNNGGIGTAYGHLAEFLVGEGHCVLILFTARNVDRETQRRWAAHYRERGIDFLTVKPASPASVSGLFGDAMRLMRDTYETLLDLGPLDVIHAPDWRGHIYYALVAKRLGLAFTDTTFCVTAHAPSLWSLNGNGLTVSSKEQLITIAAEKHLYAMADVLVSPSRYMLDWLEKRQFRLAGTQVVLPNLMSAGTRPPRERRDMAVRELVFFGRLEKRKGLDLFIEAVDRLHAGGLARDVAVTFLGKETAYGADRVAASTARWPNPVKVITEYDSGQALAYLADGDGRLAVIPSLSDNSPYTVLECLSLRIPFLASDVGGVRELINGEDADRVLSRPFSKFFAQKLEEALTGEYRFAGLAFDPEALRRKWGELHRNGLTPVPAAARPGPAQPLVTVCIPHHDRPRFLEQALRSMDAQTYPNLEVVVVDDGSREAETLAYLMEKEDYFRREDRRLIRQDNLHVSVARNTAVRHARGEYIVFMDDDNCAKPEAVETFVRCADHSGADILTCFYDGFSSDAYPSGGDVACRYTPLGKDASVGLLENCFGDANCFFTKEAFEALGGFTEIYGVGREDHEIFARAALRDMRMFVVPEPLFYYRTGRGGMSLVNRTRIEGPMRVLEAYLRDTPPELAGLLEYAFSAGVHGVRDDSLVYRMAEGLRLKIAAFERGERLLLWLRGFIMRRLR